MTCCCLNNVLLDLTEKSNIRIGCGGPMGDDGLWLLGPPNEIDAEETDRVLSTQFIQRRNLLDVSQTEEYQDLRQVSELLSFPASGWQD